MRLRRKRGLIELPAQFRRRPTSKQLIDMLQGKELTPELARTFMERIRPERVEAEKRGRMKIKNRRTRAPFADRVLEDGSGIEADRVEDGSGTEADRGEEDGSLNGRLESVVVAWNDNIHSNI